MWRPSGLTNFLIAHHSTLTTGGKITVDISNLTFSKYDWFHAYFKMPHFLRNTVLYSYCNN